MIFVLLLNLILTLYKKALKLRILYNFHKILLIQKSQVLNDFIQFYISNKNHNLFKYFHYINSIGVLSIILTHSIIL